MQLMKRYTLQILLFVMAAVMFATSCSKDDDNNNEPEPTPDPTPLVVDDDFHTVPLNITVGIAPLTGSIDGVETKKAFASGDIIVISNPDVLYEPLTISADGSAGKETANLTAELKVKKGVELVSGSTKLSAVLKNGVNYNNGKPLADVKLIEKPTDGLDQYCCWSCDDFTYSSDANAITLAPGTVFVELNMLNDNVILKIGNADFTETISGSRFYAVPAGTKVEIPNAKFEKLLDGKEQSIYHLTATAPDECLPHPFPIGEDKYVFFSKGNLQYRPLDGAWRLAPQQYHRCFNEEWFEIDKYYANWMGEDKWTDFLTVDTWIEGSSPYIMRVEDWDYTLPVDENGEIAAHCAYGAQWMVLSIDEWAYLTEQRPDAKKKCFGAVVEGVEGMVVLPDDWVAPEGLSYETEFKVEKTEEIPNQYTADDWAIMETAGALFLPEIGYIMGMVNWWYDMHIGQYHTRSLDDAADNYKLRAFMFMSQYSSCYCYDEDAISSCHSIMAVRLVQLQSGNTVIKVE